MRRRAVHDLTQAGWMPKEIATVLKVHPSAVYRTLNDLEKESTQVRSEVATYQTEKTRYFKELRA